LGVEEEDRRRTWMGDAEEAAKRGSIETARSVYAALIAAFPGKPGVWRAAAAFEKQHGSREELDALLKRAVSYCPQVGAAGALGYLVAYITPCACTGRRIVCSMVCVQA
jgi:pre-mRNA-processing factor 6